MEASHVARCTELHNTAFSDDSFTSFLYGNKEAYPDHWRRSAARHLRERLSQPDCIGRVCVSDDSDPWWDEGVGEEIIAFSIWGRSWGTTEAEKKQKRESVIFTGGLLKRQSNLPFCHVVRNGCS